MPHSFILPTDQVERIERILEELLNKTRATYVFLADISGQLIHASGRTGSVEIVPLAALTASNMAATAEMARLIGEKSHFHLLFHEGDHRNIYLSHVGESFVLAVVFDSGVQIGLVRLFSKRAVEELGKLAVQYEAVVGQRTGIMETGFEAALEGELDRLMVTP